ncbi:MAG: FmdB family zinc ribbon protein [Gammaproteobacteria bacterium]
MPIYEYRCDDCGHEMEAMQKMADAPLTDCPECGAETLVKLVSAAGFRLKGGGWYETDFKSGAKRNVAESSAPSPACGTGACPACSD